MQGQDLQLWFVQVQICRNPNEARVAVMLSMEAYVSRPGLENERYDKDTLRLPCKLHTRQRKQQPGRGFNRDLNVCGQSTAFALRPAACL